MTAKNIPYILHPSASRTVAPTMPENFNVEGKGVEVIINITDGGVDEVQTITVDAAGGTFTITYSGQTTSALAFDITAAAMQTALEALSNIDVGDVVVTGGVGAAGGGTAYSLTFGGALQHVDVAAVTTNAGSLTGGAGTATVAEATKGVAIGALVCTIQAVDPVGGGYTDILASASLASVAQTRLVVYPGIAVAANSTASNVIGYKWRLKIAHTGSAVYYSVHATNLR